MRELVANAYDADASFVKIQLLGNDMIVEDNGMGMDREGLKQYFTIGSTFKKEQQFTPKYKRRMIGEFGIGKFAVLALCGRFELFTKKNGFSGTVIFDKKDFEESQDWQVPIIEHRGQYKRSGTKVTLFQLRRDIGFDELERKLRSQLPLAEKNFSVYLNGIKLSPKFIPGRRFRIKKNTSFGTVYGEVILSSLGLPRELEGVAVVVRGISVSRSFFGLEKKHRHSTRRITGEIRADFLPLTAARDAFIKDTAEYLEFEKAVKKKITEISRDLTRLKEKRFDLKADRALSDALLKVRQALKKNSDIFLKHDLPMFSVQTTGVKDMARAVGAGVFSQKMAKKKEANAKVEKLAGKISRQLSKETARRVKTVLKDSKRLVKRIRIGGTSIVCSLAHLGKDEVESFVEGGIVFINRDHPLFAKTAKNEELASFYLIRLIAQEVALMAQPEDAAKAFSWQSRLITDALVEKVKIVKTV